MNKNQFRLFFAIDLEPAVKTYLLNVQHQLSEVVAKPVPAENFHITLSFLGDTSERQLEQILDNFQPLQIKPFSVDLNDLIYWPKPKILACSIDDQQLLTQCKKSLESQLSQIGHFRFDKRQYTPHVTLFRQVEVPCKDNQTFSASIAVERINLMVSMSSKSGVYYDTIESWALRHPSIKQQLLGL